MNFDYLKEHIGPVVSFDPPYYWKRINLHVIGDSYLDLPYPNEYAGFRVHVVKENIAPMMEYNAFIISEEDVKGLEWLKGDKA